MGVSTALILCIINQCQQFTSEAPSITLQDKWIMGGAYFTFLYMLGLHGPEGFILEVLIHQRDLQDGIVWLPLVGNLKGEDQSTGVHCHENSPCS